MFSARVLPAHHELELRMSPSRTTASCDIELPPVLECLSDPAIVIGEDHRIVAANGSYRERFAEGNAVCGGLCHEISHRYRSPCDEVGESCPIQRCRESGEPCRVLHVHYTPRGEEREDVTTYPIPDGDGATRSFLEIIRPVPVASTGPGEETLVGRSVPFNEMLGLATRVAPEETTVLLLGETGTGKELVARAIHGMSPRANEKFVPVDCSGLSESLFESELFGHERGAFTGAVSTRLGLVHACDGGTLFLDEIGDVPLTLQVKLLRLLETGVYRRVGSIEQQRSDFRLICATHRDLRGMVEQGSFRADLYYRISAFPIRLPPLRERILDLPLLLESLGSRLGYQGLESIHPDTLKRLADYEFPGNVRELLHIVERARLLSDGDTMLPEHLPEEVRGSTCPVVGGGPSDEILSLAEVERRYLLWATAVFPGEKRELAERLGLSERTLYRKLQAIRAVRS